MLEIQTVKIRVLENQLYVDKNSSVTLYMSVQNSITEYKTRNYNDKKILRFGINKQFRVLHLLTARCRNELLQINIICVKLLKPTGYVIHQQV